MGAPRPSSLPRPAVRDTSGSASSCLLSEVSSPGAGTDRSHAPGCRYNVLTSCMRPCWQTGHMAPGSPADTAGILRSTATSRAWGWVPCPKRVRHCASFSWRTRLAKKPKWRILWNPLMQCTALAGLCRLQRYADFAVGVSYNLLKLGHFNDECSHIALHNLAVYSCVQSALERRRVTR